MRDVNDGIACKIDIKIDYKITCESNSQIEIKKKFLRIKNWFECFSLFQSIDFECSCSHLEHPRIDFCMTRYKHIITYYVSPLMVAVIVYFLLPSVFGMTDSLTIFV